MGDEGGFAPNLPSAEAALDFCLDAIRQAGFKPGADIVLAMDCAVTDWFKDGAYHYEGEGKVRSPDEQSKYLAKLAADYPIASIEDGMAEDDWAGWKLLTDAIGDRCQIVGDDLFVTNTSRLARGIREGIANSLLVKVNQIGSLTETLAAVEMAQTGRLYRRNVASLRRDRGCDRSPISRSPPIAGRSRRGRWRGRTGSRSTTS